MGRDQARRAQAGRRRCGQMIAEYVQNFVDVTTLDDDGQKLQHVATGRILTIKASWDDALS